MVLVLDNSGYVFGYNPNRSKDSVNYSKNEVWFDGDFNFDMGENIEGKYKKFKYVDGEIEIVYFDIPVEPIEPEPTEEEIAQAEMLLMQAEILEKLNAMEV